MSRLSGEYRLTSVDKDHVKTISYFHESFSISRLVRVNFESATSRRADNENPEFDAVGLSAVALCAIQAAPSSAAPAATNRNHAAAGDCCDFPPPLSALLNPSTLTWTGTGSGKFDVYDEEGWTLLPNGTVLTVDAYVFTFHRHMRGKYGALLARHRRLDQRRQHAVNFGRLRQWGDL
jgi:hypothetical protein